MSTDSLPLRTVWVDHDGVRAGAISGSALPGPSRYVERSERNLLASGTAMPFDVLLTAARRTIAAHNPQPVVEERENPHARWRDLVRPPKVGEPTVYRRRTCRACRDGACELLDAAKFFEAVVGPLVAAEKRSRAAA